MNTKETKNQSKRKKLKKLPPHSKNLFFFPLLFPRLSLFLSLSLSLFLSDYSCFFISFSALALFPKSDEKKLSPFFFPPSTSAKPSEE